MLLWDIIFSDVNGVFQTAFQGLLGKLQLNIIDAPLDLMTDAFYITRCNAIDKRLEEIRNSNCLGDLVEIAFTNKGRN